MPTKTGIDYVPVNRLQKDAFSWSSKALSMFR